MDFICEGQEHFHQIVIYGRIVELLESGPQSWADGPSSKEDHNQLIMKLFIIQRFSPIKTLEFNTVSQVESCLFIFSLD